MQMGPYSAGTRRAHPDQIVRAISPLVEQAQRDAQGGIPLAAAIREAVLAGFMAGTGMPLNSAAELVRQWRLSGMSTELQRPAMPEAQPQPQHAEPQSLVPTIEAQMKDEISATVFYGALMEEARRSGAGDTVVEYIRHAMEDERNHYNLLRQLHKTLSGRDYDVQPEKVEFRSLPEGLLMAMNDEYEAFEDYREVYLASEDRRVRNVYFELMTDELEHATRFNYALQVVETETT